MKSVKDKAKHEGAKTSKRKTMPREFVNYCPNCINRVTNNGKTVRETKGVYIAINHQCPQVRVFDLNGKLLEVACANCGRPKGEHSREALTSEVG